MVLEFLNSILNFIFWPLLIISPFWGILIISIVVSLITTLAHKYFTDQNLMKQLKDETKTLQDQIKTLKEHPEKQLEVQKKLMETNMKYSMHSFKPLFITFIPIIIIFSWLNAHFGFDPVKENQEFSITVFLEKNMTGSVSIDVPEGLNLVSDKKKSITDGQSIFVLKGKNGDYLVDFNINDKKYSKEVKIDNKEYTEVEKIIKDGQVSSIKINHAKTVVLNLFGWQLGWLGSYIIFSIVFSILLRKVMNVY